MAVLFYHVLSSSLAAQRSGWPPPILCATAKSLPLPTTWRYTYLINALSFHNLSERRQWKTLMNII
jgi:hypothetical protein